MAQTASQKLENRIELLSSIRQPNPIGLPPVYSVRVKYQHNPCPKATNAALVTASANDYSYEIKKVHAVTCAETHAVSTGVHATRDRLTLRVIPCRIYDEYFVPVVRTLPARTKLSCRIHTRTRMHNQNKINFTWLRKTTPLDCRCRQAVAKTVAQNGTQR